VTDIHHAARPAEDREAQRTAVEIDADGRHAGPRRGDVRGHSGAKSRERVGAVSTRAPERPERENRTPRTGGHGRPEPRHRHPETGGGVGADQDRTVSALEGSEPLRANRDEDLSISAIAVAGRPMSSCVGERGHGEHRDGEEHSEEPDPARRHMRLLVAKDSGTACCKGGAAPPAPLSMRRAATPAPRGAPRTVQMARAPGEVPAAVPTPERRRPPPEHWTFVQLTSTSRLSANCEIVSGSGE
jgi:hypothetical protein